MSAAARRLTAALATACRARQHELVCARRAAALVMHTFPMERRDAYRVVYLVQHALTGSAGSAAVREAMRLARSLGIDWQVLAAAASAGEGRQP